MNVIKRIFYYLYRPQVNITFNNPIYYYLRNRGHLLNAITGMFPFHFKKRFMDLIVMERIVEIPFMYKNLNLKEGSNILEIGCVDSRVSIELASLGYKVTGYDLRDYSFSHPNFRFIKGDFLKNNFPDEYFDGVIAISTIEHCGIEIYGSTSLDDADRRVIDEIYRVLKKKGRFIITVPFGLRGQNPFYRIYDAETLRALLKDFSIIEEKYFRTIDRKYWIVDIKENLANLDSRPYTQAVACIVCEKP